MKKFEKKSLRNKDFLYNLIYNEKLNIKDIADNSDISEQTVRNYVKKYNIGPRTVLKKRAEDLLTKEYLEEYFINKAYSIDEISNITDISTSYIFKYIKKYNIKRNDNSLEAAKIRSNEKRINTVKRKYKVENVFSSESIQEKSRKTMLDKYGVEYSVQSRELQEKISNSIFQKYGVKSSFLIPEVRDAAKKAHKENSEKINEKRLSTMRERYGEDLSEVSKKIRQTNIDRYGVSTPIERSDIKNKIHETKKTNGLIISFDNKTLKQWSNELGISIHVLNNNITLNTTYNEFISFIENYQGEGLTDIEKIISKELRIDFFGKTVLKSRPDFKLSNKLYLNIDGLYWHSEFVQKNKNYHFNLRKKFENADMQIIQLREDEVYNKLDIIKSILNSKRGTINDRVFARKTEIKIVQQKVAKQFLINNHLMGTTKARHIGLYYKNNLISILSYKIYDQTLKIERFCSIKNTIVIGGLSKLLNYLIKTLNIKEIHSWVDLRYGSGSSLNTLGFKKERETLGWKWAYCNGRNNITYNRLYCRANMDNRRLSEKEYAEELNLARIYDAGQRLYIKKIIT